jgi:hypothetical protein
MIRTSGRLSFCAACAAIAMLLSAPVAFAGAPDIGGNPLVVESTVFGGADIEVTVYSYVFSLGREVPPTFRELSADESLFVYIVRNSGPVDVDTYALLNPDEIEVHGIGNSPILPQMWNEDRRNNPDFLYGGVDGVQYVWTDDPNFDLFLLRPGEWAISFFRVIGFWQPVDAFAGNFDQGDYDVQLVPGPAIVPEPASLALLAVVGLVLRRPRGRA